MPVEEAHFSKDILLGTAISEYQYSGQVNCPNNQWAEWEKTLPEPKQSGKAWDLWNRPAECVQILKNHHFTSFRFSVEWSKIEPEPGVYDFVALQHYVDFCKMLKKEGIEPMVTLHHFTHPTWFEELGAFEKEENIARFVSFSEVVYKALKGDVSLWCTINEPTIVAFSGYFLGAFPPSLWSPYLGAKVLRNLLKAHCETYRALKAIDEKPQIGIVHQSLKFVPYRFFDRVVTAPLTEVTHGASMRFFETGQFELLGANLKEEEIDKLNDFIGVNCYVRPLISLFQSTHHSHEHMTLMPFREDPAAIYDALIEMHQKTNKPIYVTEVGISTHDEAQLERYMERALYAIYRAQKEGVDLRGIYWWSLMNNWEWDRTWDHNFGICHDDGSPRRGAKPLLRLMGAFSSSRCIPA